MVYTDAQRYFSSPIFRASFCANPLVCTFVYPLGVCWREGFLISTAYPESYRKKSTDRATDSTAHHNILPSILVSPNCHYILRSSVINQHSPLLQVGDITSTTSKIFVFGHGIRWAVGVAAISTIMHIMMYLHLQIKYHYSQILLFLFFYCLSDCHLILALSSSSRGRTW